MKLPPEFFENKKEQSEIKLAVSRAIPKDVYYHNLIIVFSEMLSSFVYRAFNDEVYNKSIKEKE